MSKEPVILLGFGGNAVDFFETISWSHEILGFVDDDETKRHLEYKGIKVHDRSFLDAFPDAKIISLIGSEKTFRTRHEIIDQFNIPFQRFAFAIHPRASISSDCQIGHDVVILPGVVLTSNARVGNHVFILANTVLHHDVVVNDYTLIGSGVTLAGHVRVGKSCFIGSAVSVKNNVTIGDSTIIGMASNVLNDVAQNSRCVGNPAKPI
jgi:sugar O-acyltransferase (sialic acid O-acetyltransferase NeuD family)